MLETPKFLIAFLNFLRPIDEYHIRRLNSKANLVIQRYRQWNIGGIPCVSSDQFAKSPKAFMYSNTIYAPNFTVKPPNFSLKPPSLQLSHQSYRGIYCCLSYYGTEIQWGLEALVVIPSKTLLFSYTGEMISTMEKKRRQKIYDRKTVS